MPEFITLEEAARITGFPSQEIQQYIGTHVPYHHLRKVAGQVFA